MSTEGRCPECHGYRGLPRILHDEEVKRECSNEFHKTSAPVELPEPIQFPSPATMPDTLQVSNVAVQDGQSQQVRKPVCPYCLTEGKIAGGLTDLGPFKVLVIRCGNNECRKFLAAFQPLSMEVVTPQGPGVH